MRRKITSVIGKVRNSKQKVIINVGNTALQSERMNKIHMQKLCVQAKVLHTKAKIKK